LVVATARPPSALPPYDPKAIRDPEVAFRITGDHDSAGHGQLAIGVADLAAERSRLALHWAEVPEATQKPGVIALLRLRDPDANAVTPWQDLLGSRRG
jgi:hypothetical protein